VNHLLGGSLVEFLGHKHKFLFARFYIATLNSGANLPDLGPKGTLDGAIVETAVLALTQTLLGTD
jgi:hypothetical protein